MNNIITEIKKSMESREARVSELKERTVEITQHEQERGNMLR